LSEQGVPNRLIGGIAGDDVVLPFRRFVGKAKDMLCLAAALELLPNSTRRHMHGAIQKRTF